MDYQRDNTCETNCAIICGEIIEECKYNHRTYGEDFYVFKIAIKRNSGYEDEIIVMASERIIKTVEICKFNRISVVGQIRTYNEELNGKNKLNIVIFAKELNQEDVEVDSNEIYLEGFLCKVPVQRTSPLGRKICDLMIAVNRMYNKSDYVPCIAWGRNAIYASTLNVGDKIIIRGRIQSREYRKKLSDGDIIYKTAYEVSVISLETISPNVV